MQLPKHGANPHRLYEKMKIPMPDVIYDFSENVNAFGLPPRIRKEWPTLLSEISVYPDPFGEPFLSAAANFHAISKEQLFIGNGAAEVLALLAERYRSKTAIIVHPTFSEYEATLEAKDVTVHRIIAAESTGFQLPLAEIKTAMNSADVLYLCTPNNPTGLLPSKEVLMMLIEYGQEVQCEVVLDEAFIDFIDESLSFIQEIQRYENLIVVRSMTKMYAIPGIRLGYMIAKPSIIKEVQSLAPHWNVNGLAARVGAICFEEQEFVEQTKVHSERERRKLTDLLHAYGCTTTASVANFIVFKLADETKTKQLAIDLLEKGIVLRHTENFLGMDGNWLRIGMKQEAVMSLLRKELSQWFSEN